MKLIPRLEGGMNDAHPVLVVRVAPFAQHHRPEAVGTYLDTGSPKCSIAHEANLGHHGCGRFTA